MPEPTKKGEQPKKPTKPGLLSQEDLDALIASDADSGPAEPAGGSDEAPRLLNQSELDELLGYEDEQETGTPAAEDPASVPDPARSDALITEEETEEGGGAGASSGESDSKSLTQEDLDALIEESMTAAFELDTGDVEPEEEEESAEGESSQTDESTSDSGLMDQAELDALFAQVSNGEDGAASQEVEKPTAAAAEAPGEDEGDDVAALLSQSELDRLLEQSGEPTEYRPEVIEGSAEEKVSVLTESELDEVLAETTNDHPISDRTLDEVLPQEEEPPEDTMEAVLPGGEEQAGYSPGAVDQSSIDSILADVTGSLDVSLDGVEESGDDVGNENLAAAAPVESGDDDLLTQDLLDSLLQEAGESPESEGQEPADLNVVTEAAPPVELPPDEPEPVPSAGPSVEEMPPAEDGLSEEAVVSAPSGKRGRFRKPLIPNPLGWIPAKERPKVAASLAIGLLAALAAFVLLYGNRERYPTSGMTASFVQQGLRSAVEEARYLVEVGQYEQADALLSGFLEAGRADPDLLADAQYLRAEARYRALPSRLSEMDMVRVQAEIERVMRDYPAHERVPEAMGWKADLYVRGDMPHAAFGVYERIIQRYPGEPELEQVYMDAAKLALELERPDKAVEYIEAQEEQFPGSSLRGKAQLMLAEALAAENKRDEAREILEQIARAQPDTRLGAQAAARLARIALDRGRNQEAINLLEDRLATAVTTDGNDEVYLMLATAYEAAGDRTRAEQVLRDLIAFFPDTTHTASAYVHLSRLLESAGQPQEAMSLAMQAAQRYPTNPEVMAHLGRIRAKGSDDFGAAQALVAADKAGARDPRLLLEAARLYREAGLTEESLQTYDDLALYYPATQQAYQGMTEYGEVLFAEGRMREAVEHMEDLAELTEATSRRLPVILALGRMYETLGFDEPMRTLYEEVARVSTEPPLLAQAAIALLRNGGLDEGIAVANRLDTERLDDGLAYRLMSEHGLALLQADPPRGMERMRRAYDLFPKQRQMKYDKALLDAYLAVGRTADARYMVRSIESHVASHPEDGGRLKEAALAWADYLYRKRDFREAADAYATATQVAHSLDPDNDWARYQHAGALLQAGDVDRSIPALRDIAEDDTEWSPYARVKLAYAEAAQRARGSGR